MMSTTASTSRIIVLSSTPTQARTFVERIKTLSDNYSQSLKKPEQGTSSLSSSDSSSDSIPWTIVNRYYTADVHFETRTLQDFSAHHATSVPAVIYVWNNGEEHIPSIASKLESHDPEVSLAIRFGGDHVVHSDEEDGMDEFLSIHGFEYINGELGGRRPTRDGAGFSDEQSSGVSGLPRVIDALSTIMWPSLVQSDATESRRSRARNLLDWARAEDDEDGLQALVARSDPGVGAIHSADLKTSRMQREMEELERWLEQEDHDAEKRRKEDDRKAWISAEEADAWQNILETPTIVTPPHDGELGFEDDFDDFVGAPMGISYGHERHNTIREPSDHLVPMHTGASYHSLASAEGLSEILDTSIVHGYDNLDEIDDRDPDLPSRQEIEETTRRIFGPQIDVPPPPVPPASGQSSSHQSTIPASDSSFTFPTSDGDGEDFDFGPFDLSHVLSALQGMKEEISGITDEGERRKAAARVALGLVYGLEKEDMRVGENN
ncbi:unnamed protein product [Somion occarium]|uniref:Uncharacterized protein n=1 Tax=Somion occarium TaxID=3059160 RepID=A0ABP1DPK8_9APHY